MKSARWGKRDDPWIVPSRHVALIVFAFLLLKILSIYLYCMGRFDGSFPVLWLDPTRLGLSLEQWFQSLHALFAIWLLLVFWIQPHPQRGRTRLKRGIELVFAAMLLIGSSLVVHAWGNLSRWELEKAEQSEREGVAAFERVRSSFDQDGGAPWAGIYEGFLGWNNRHPDDGWVETLAISPKEGLVRRMRRAGYTTQRSVAWRSFTESWAHYDIRARSDGFVLPGSRRRPDRGGTLYKFIHREDQSWLVPSVQLKGFEAGAEPNSVGALRRVE